MNNFETVIQEELKLLIEHAGVQVSKLNQANIAVIKFNLPEQNRAAEELEMLLLIGMKRVESIKSLITEEFGEFSEQSVQKLKEMYPSVKRSMGELRILGQEYKINIKKVEHSHSATNDFVKSRSGGESINKIKSKNKKHTYSRRGN